MGKGKGGWEGGQSCHVRDGQHHQRHYQASLAKDVPHPEEEDHAEDGEHARHKDPEEGCESAAARLSYQPSILKLSIPYGIRRAYTKKGLHEEGVTRRMTEVWMKEGEEDGRYTSRDEEMQGCGASVVCDSSSSFQF